MIYLYFGLFLQLVVEKPLTMIEILSSKVSFIDVLYILVFDYSSKKTEDEILFQKMLEKV